MTICSAAAATTTSPAAPAPTGSGSTPLSAATNVDDILDFPSPTIRSSRPPGVHADRRRRHPLRRGLPRRRRRRRRRRPDHLQCRRPATSSTIRTASAPSPRSCSLPSPTARALTTPISSPTPGEPDQAGRPVCSPGDHRPACRTRYFVNIIALGGGRHCPSVPVSRDRARLLHATVSSPGEAAEMRRLRRREETMPLTIFFTRRHLHDRGRRHPRQQHLGRPRRQRRDHPDLPPSGRHDDLLADTPGVHFIFNIARLFGTADVTVGSPRRSCPSPDSIVVKACCAPTAS